MDANATVSDVDEIRRLVATVNRMLYMEDHVSYSGHVSMRHLDEDVAYINPLSASRGEIRPEDVVAVTLDDEPVDPEATMGTAMVPCSPIRADREITPGYLHLGRAHNSGTPIIAGDGMARAGLTGYVAAEAILAGVEPQPYVYRAHRGWAWRNQLAHYMFNELSWVADPALKWAPGRALNLIQDFGETWAGLEAE
jgi:hypothetical protein